MSLKRWLVPLLFFAGVYFDSIFFGRVNIYGIRPDILLALIVSYGFLMGSVPAALIGAGIGLGMDVLFNGCVGLYAICYMTAGFVGGLFYQKFYADNVIMPALIATLCHFGAEHVLALSMVLRGGAFRYLVVMPTYILPCAVFTGGLCVPLHLLLRYALEQQTKLRGSEMHG